MKKYIISILILILANYCGHAQKVIPAGTAISAVSTLPNGLYVIVNAPGDSIFFNKDTSLSIVRFKHDTVTITKTCPPPIICPICPTFPKQRTANGVTWDIISNKKIITYDDNSPSTIL